MMHGTTNIKFSILRGSSPSTAEARKQVTAVGSYSSITEHSGLLGCSIMSVH